MSRIYKFKENDKVIGVNKNNKDQIGVVVKILKANYYNVKWDEDNIKKCLHSSIEIYKDNIIDNLDKENTSKTILNNKLSNSSFSPFSSSSSLIINKINNDNLNNINNKEENNSIVLIDLLDKKQNQINNNALSSRSNSITLSGRIINNSKPFDCVESLLDQYSTPQDDEDSNFDPINTFEKLSDDELFQKFLQAAEKGLSYEIITMLKQDNRTKEFINKKHKEELYTALMWASKNGHLDVVKTLLSLKANVNIQGGWNQSTALMKACEKGKFEIVEALINANANVNLTNNHGYTALMLASYKLNDKDGIKIVKSLCENKAKINVQDKYKWTALIYAVEFNRIEIVKCLLEYKAKVLHENIYGKSAIMMAGEKGYLNILKLLYEVNPNPSALNGRSKIGKSILVLACLNDNNIDVVKFLVENGAIIDPEPFINEKGEVKIIDTPLLMACERGHIDIVQYLVEKNANKDAKNSEGHNSLMKACGGIDSKKASELVKLLLKDNMDVTSFVDLINGDTCLMLACKKGHIDVIVQLINYIFKNSDNFRDLSTLPYFNAVNKNGENAISMLCTYFSDNESSLKDFIKKATSPDHNLNTNDYPTFLLDIFPFILRNMVNPSSFFNSKLCDTIFDGLKEMYAIHDEHGKLKDSYFFTSLINILWALRWAAETHPLEKRDLDERYDDIDRMVNSIFKSDCLDKIENICSLFLNSITNFDEKDENDNKNNNQYSIIKHAETFTVGPLSKCIDYGLIKCLGTSQVSWYVEKMFDASLRTINVKSIRNWEDIFQIRSQCQNLRYCPKTMFLLESLSKITLLCSLFYVSSELYNVFDIIQMKKNAEIQQCVWSKENNTLPTCSWYISEYFLSFMLFTTILYECGEIRLTHQYLIKNKNLNNNDSKKFDIFEFIFESDTTFKEYIKIIVNHIFEFLYRNIFESDTTFKEYIKVIVNHFCKDTWNILDIFTIVCLIGWFFFRSFDNIDMARSCLAVTAVPLSLNLLRLLTLFEEAGCLVFTIFEMTKDLKTFAIVFFTAIFGFIVAFHSLFQVRKHSEDDFNKYYFATEEEYKSFNYESYINLHEKFGSIINTIFTMFYAALGEYPSECFAKSIHIHLATILTTIYALLATVILLNLVVAKMSATHDKINEGAFSTWCAMKAKNVKDFLLIYERNSLCMLPPPLNSVSTIVSLFAKDTSVSTAGTVSDSLLCLLSSPFFSICEIFYAYDHLLTSKCIDKNYRYGTTLGTALFFPVWFCISWILIIWNVLMVLYFSNNRYIKIVSKTNRIDYSEKNNNKETFGLNKKFIEFLFVAFSICYISIIDYLLEDYYIWQFLLVIILYLNCCWCIIKFYPIHQYNFLPKDEESANNQKNSSQIITFFKKRKTILWIFAIIIYLIWQYFSKPILYSIIIVAIISSYLQIFYKEKETKLENVRNINNGVKVDLKNPAKIPGSGTFVIKVVRGSFINIPDSNIGRKHNIIIRISYADQVHVIKPKTPVDISNIDIHHPVPLRFYSGANFKKEIEIDIFDLDDNFCDKNTIVYENAIKLLSKTENIQEWLANTKYQGNIVLNDLNNKETKSTIQVDLYDFTFELEEFHKGLSFTRGMSVQSSNNIAESVVVPPVIPLLNRQLSSGSICPKVFTSQDRDRIFESYYLNK